MTQQTDLFDVVYNYSIGNTQTISADALSLLTFMMGNKLNTAVFREKIVSRALGYEHNSHVHGLDAFDSVRNTQIEIKAEQADSIQTADRAKHLQLTGTGNFGHTTVKEIHNKFVNTPFLINHGLFWDGKLLAIFEFSSTHPGILASVKQYARRQEEGSKGSIKYVGGDWTGENKNGVTCRWYSSEHIAAAKEAGILKKGSGMSDLIFAWAKMLEDNYSLNRKSISYK